jgi:hypothetical protein
LNSIAVGVRDTEIILSFGVPLIRCLSEPLNSFLMIF